MLNRSIFDIYINRYW